MVSLQGRPVFLVQMLALLRLVRGKVQYEVLHFLRATTQKGSMPRSLLRDWTSEASSNDNHRLRRWFLSCPLSRACHFPKLSFCCTRSIWWWCLFLTYCLTAYSFKP